MSYRILINGAAGRMGQLADAALSSVPGFTVVARCGRQKSLMQEVINHNAQIVLDFTNADSVYENALAILQANARPVIGTSGLRQHQVEELQAIANGKGIGGIIVPNFSLAGVLLMYFAKKAAPYFEQAEIIELHHERKVDAPSGTAIRTAELMTLNPAHTAFAHNVPQDARGVLVNHIPVHSVRLPGIMAQQQVILGNQDETLTLEYNTLDRCAYQAGIILACQKVMSLEKLEYGLECLMNLT